MQNKFSEERVQSIMESFGGMQPAAAPDFFYTRLRAKMEQPAEEKKTFFILRPAFITAALAVLLIANVISLLQTDKLPKQEQTFVQSKPATIESFAAAYDMNPGSVYE
ncbi:MAG: hypothetical protein JNM14_14305 [Ferruginibacter sp.]|nr:hypothetical protein [Ferruginibacter sp.]